MGDRDQTWLVTGASGLLGQTLANDLAERYRVVGTTLSTPLTTDLFEIRRTDLSSPDAIDAMIDEVQPDVVIHCAALADIDACEREPLRAHELNAEIPARIAARCAAEAITMVHISTDAVFDGTGGPYIESDEPHPIHVYGETKLAGERRVLDAHPASLVTRVNFFGWSASRRGLAQFFLRRLREGQPLLGFTDVSFAPLYSRDLVDVIQAGVEAGLSGVYHAGGSQELTKFDFGRALAAEFGLDGELVRPGVSTSLETSRGPRLTLDSSALERRLGRSLPSAVAGLSRMRSDELAGYPDALIAQSAA